MSASRHTARAMSTRLRSSFDVLGSARNSSMRLRPSRIRRRAQTHAPRGTTPLVATGCWDGESTRSRPWRRRSGRTAPRHMTRPAGTGDHRCGPPISHCRRRCNTRSRQPGGLRAASSELSSLLPGVHAALVVLEIVHRGVRDRVGQRPLPGFAREPVRFVDVGAESRFDQHRRHERDSGAPRDSPA